MQKLVDFLSDNGYVFIYKGNDIEVHFNEPGITFKGLLRELNNSITDEDLYCLTSIRLSRKYATNTLYINKILKARGISKKNILNNIKLLISNEELFNNTPSYLKEKYLLSPEQVSRIRKERNAELEK
jgi:hypothetical protein